MSTGNSMKYPKSKSNINKRVYTPEETAKYLEEKKVLREARRQAAKSQSPPSKQVAKIKSEDEDWSGQVVSSDDDWESDSNNVPLQTLESKVDVPNNVPLQTLESKVDVPVPTVHDALMDLMSKYNNPRVNMPLVYMFVCTLMAAVSTTTAKVVVKMSDSMKAYVNMMVCFPKAVTETAFYSVVKSALVRESPATESGLAALEELLTKEPDAAMTMANLHAVLMEAIVVASCSVVPKAKEPEVPKAKEPEVPKAKEPETPKKVWVDVDAKVPDAPKKALVTKGPMPSPARKILRGPKCSKEDCHETPDHNPKTKKPYPFCRQCTEAHLLSKSTTSCSNNGCNMPTFGPKCRWCPGCVKSHESQEEKVPCSNSENPQFFKCCDQRTANGHGRCNGCLSYFKQVTNGEESMECLNNLSYKYAETDEIAESLYKKFGEICKKVTEGTRPYCTACYNAHSRK